MDHKEREQAVTRTSIVGIITNILFAAFKAGAGLLAGSIAIVLDAVNNLTDALSSVITIIGIKLAKRRPDHSHPFGYGRVEYLGTVVIALLVLFAGVTSVIESVKSILHPEMPEYSVITVVIVIVSVIVKLLLGRYVKGQGEKYNSDALVASGTEASFDALISASTLLGAIVALLFKISIDAYIAAVISLFIVKAGLETLMEALNHMVGNRPDSEITKSIKAAVAAIPGVMGAYDLVLHDYGPDSAIGSVHVEVPAEYTAGQIHKLTEDIQTAIAETYHVFLTVGIYAVDILDEEKKAARDRVRSIVNGFDGVVNSHGVFIDSDTGRICFDAVVDFTAHDRDALRKSISEAVEAAFPGYRAEVSFDTNYSD